MRRKIIEKFLGQRFFLAFRVGARGDIMGFHIIFIFIINSAFFIVTYIITHHIIVDTIIKTSIIAMIIFFFIFIIIVILVFMTTAQQAPHQTSHVAWNSFDGQVLKGQGGGIFDDIMLKFMEHYFHKIYSNIINISAI